MKHSFVTFAGVAVAAGLFSLLDPMSASAQATKPAPKAQTKAAAKKSAPKTAWGQPDLQGVWNYSTLTPLERPADLAGKEFLTEKEAEEYEKKALQNVNKDRRDGSPEADLSRAYNDAWYEYGTISKTRRTSLVIDPPDGRIPAWTPEAKRREDARPNWYNTYNRRESAGPDPADTWADRNLSERCMSRGAPRLPSSANNNFQIVQEPNYVAILHEMIHEVRIIPLDNRPHVSKNIRFWLGDSRGHWEGDTLVVDTTNYNEGSIRNIFHCCRGSSTNLHVIERFRRADEKTLDYQYTVDDPTTFTKPFTVSVPAMKIDDPIYEYACHEGNFTSMSSVLKEARAQEKAAAEKKK